MKAWPILGISVVQIILFLAHWFLYLTWLHFGWPLGPGALSALRIALIALSLSFIVAALLSFRFTHPVIAFLYKVAVVWLGFLNFLFVAACAAWFIELFTFLIPQVGRNSFRHFLAGFLLVAVVVSALYALVNARTIRTRHITVRLPNLPVAWRGRTALLLTDLHLGNVNGVRFARRIASLERALKPHIVLISGDLYDGVKDKPLALAAPLLELAPPLGAFFVTGNHEVFGRVSRYTDALEGSSIQVLDNRSVVIDGLHLAGVSYERSTSPIALRTFLESLALRGDQPSILLNHVPHRLPIVAECGISLQLSGHTHSGQMFPFTWFARRAFGPFTYGLSRLGSLQVYTSSGVGTWGPPMRLGTAPEVVLFTFEQ